MTASPVRMTVQWTVPYGQTTAITTALHELMITTRNERGCLECSLATEVSARVKLHYQEGWETEDDLKRHVRSEQFARLAGLVEQAAEVPSIDFTLPQGHRGIDYADQVRRGVVAPDPATGGTAPARDSGVGGPQARTSHLDGSRQ